MNVLVLKSERLVGDALIRVARGVLPHACFCLVTRVAEAYECVADRSFEILVSGITTCDGDSLGFLSDQRERHDGIPRILVATRRQELHVLATLKRLRLDGVFDCELEGLDAFETAIRAIAAGQTYWSRSVIDKLIFCLLPGSPYRSLSLKERTLLALFGSGQDDKAIADHLGLKVSTVRSTCRELHRKLGVQHRRSLMCLAIQYGVVQVLRDGTVLPRPSIAEHLQVAETASSRT